MKKIRNVYISGLGAIGGAYGSRIFDSDPGSVNVIADSGRIRRYSETGVRINGRLYPFKYVTPESGRGEADLVLIAVKHHQLEQSIADIEKYVSEDTVILSLLNGIVSEDAVGRKYGMDKILHSFAVGTDALRDGENINFTNIGKIVFGAKDSSGIEKVNAVKEFFDRTSVPYAVPGDIIRELWWKFMMNVGVNQVSAVLKANYGVFQRIPEARELMKMASAEVVELAEKSGISIGMDDIEKYIKIINELSPEGKTSMFQDMEAGRKTEVEIFSGTVIELGEKYGVATPVNNMLFRMIKTEEKMKQQS